MYLSILLLLLVALTQLISSLAFQIYWNVPSRQCKKVRPDKYNITTNEGRKFLGDKFVIFYERDLGLYPWCESDDKEPKNECQNPVNGGVPQNVDMAAHLEKVKLDVARAIPNPDYDSLAIIDYERWRPLFDLNWSSRSVYKTYSTKLIMEKYPKMTQYTATYLARFTFDNAAKDFFLKTIWAAKEVRPKAKWAYWDYPLCNYDVGYSSELECKPEYGILNEQLLWMYNASDIIIPPVYFYDERYPPELRQKHVYAKIVKTEEIVQKLYPKKLPIYVYIKMEYITEWNKTSDTLISAFYTKADVCNSVKFPYDMGVDGIIIWGTSNYMKHRCDLMANFLDNILGPFTSAVIHKASKCSQKQCNGRGKCIAGKRLPLVKCELAYQPETMCICDDDYTGRNCKIQRSTTIDVPQTADAVLKIGTQPSTELSETTVDFNTTENMLTTLAITPNPSPTPSLKSSDANATTTTTTERRVDSKENCD